MVTVGIDPHKHVYVAVAVDADGRRPTRPLTVKNDADLIGVPLKRIRTNTDGTPITWALKDGRGFARRLADGLLLTGHEVVWVPIRLMSAHHKLHAATGSKFDPVDTTAVAHTAIATRVWTVTASTTARASCAYSSTHGLTSHGRWSPTGAAARSGASPSRTPGEADRAPAEAQHLALSRTTYAAGRQRIHCRRGQK